MSEATKIEAIIRLLDDPDDEVFDVVKMQLYNEGVSVIKQLEITWENTDNEMIQQRIELLTREIQLNHVSQEMSNWAISGNHDLLEASFWIAKYQYPSYDFNTFEGILNQIITDVKEEIHDDNTPLEKITLINHIFYQSQKFTRTFSTIHSPQNFYINNVLQTKKGNFFSLALLYAGIGQRLGIPLMALNLPDNFAIAFINPRLTDLPIDEHSSLFFINPANKGAVFGRHEIDDFLKKLKIKPESYYYIPMHNIDAIILQLEYLILSYTKLDMEEKVNDLRSIQNRIRNT
jgi:regulator of sirC expression with transglutaminase-like and TPR domain